MVPKYVFEKIEGAQAYFNFRGRCVFCDMIHQEYEDKDRIVTENEDFWRSVPLSRGTPLNAGLSLKGTIHSLSG